MKAVASIIMYFYFKAKHKKAKKIWFLTVTNILMIIKDKGIHHLTLEQKHKYKCRHTTITHPLKQTDNYNNRMITNQFRMF